MPSHHSSSCKFQLAIRRGGKQLCTFAWHRAIVFDFLIRRNYVARLWTSSARLDDHALGEKGCSAGSSFLIKFPCRRHELGLKARVDQVQMACSTRRCTGPIPRCQTSNRLSSLFERRLIIAGIGVSGRSTGRNPQSVSMVVGLAPRRASASWASGVEQTRNRPRGERRSGEFHIFGRITGRSFSDTGDDASFCAVQQSG